MLRLILLVTLAMIAFAANSILARLALGNGDASAIGYTGVRLAAGAGTLAILVLAQRRPLQLVAATRSPVRWTAATALLVYALAFSAAYLQLGAGTGALILFATVQLTMLGWGMFKGDRPSLLALLGLAVALAAFVYLVSPGLRAPDPLGAILMAAAGVAWAVYTLLGRGSDDPLRDTAQNFILTLPLAFIGIASVALAPLAWPAVGWAILSGALASGIGYAIWYAALPQLTRTRAGIVQLSVPAIAAIGGILLLGESPTWRLAISAALILGGVATAILAPARKR